MQILREKLNSLCAAFSCCLHHTTRHHFVKSALHFTIQSIIDNLRFGSERRERGEREAATKASKSIQLNARLLLLLSLPLMWIWYACKFVWLLSIFYGYRWDLHVDIIEKIILGMFVMLHYCVAIEIKFENVEFGVNARLFMHDAIMIMMGWGNFNDGMLKYLDRITLWCGMFEVLLFYF